MTSPRIPLCTPLPPSSDYTITSRPPLLVAPSCFWSPVVAPGRRCHRQFAGPSVSREAGGTKLAIRLNRQSVLPEIVLKVFSDSSLGLEVHNESGEDSQISFPMKGSWSLSSLNNFFVGVISFIGIDIPRAGKVLHHFEKAKMRFST